MIASQQRERSRVCLESFQRACAAAVVLLATGCVTMSSTSETSRLNAGILSFFDGRRITPGTDSIAIFLVQQTDTIEIGWARDSISMDTVDGTPVLHRVYESADRMFGQQRQEIFDRRTLQPVSQRFEGLGRRFAIEFGPRSVEGWMEQGDPPVRRQLEPVPYAPPTLNAASFDLAVRSMTIEPGFNFVIQGYSGLTEDLMRLAATVTGRLFEPSAREPYVIVNVDFDGVPWTFFVGEETRKLVRMEWESTLGTVLYRNLTAEGKDRDVAS